MGEIPPSEDTIIKRISGIRNHPENPLDKPFSIGCIMALEFPPDSIPILLEIIIMMQRHALEPLSIRQARWISRLYVVVEKLKARTPGLSGDDPQLLLWLLADLYAAEEQAWEIVGDLEKPLDTSELDRWFITSMISEDEEDPLAPEVKLESSDQVSLYDALIFSQVLNKLDPLLEEIVRTIRKEIRKERQKTEGGANERTHTQKR